MEILKLKHLDLNLQNLYQLKKFLDENKDCFEKFRYFKKRSLKCIESHFLTRLYFDEVGNCVGYGHLDRQEVLWLGICVGDLYRGKGYGDLILSDLIHNADSDIFLTVDIENFVAQKLYKKYNFEVVIMTENYLKMKKTK